MSRHCPSRSSFSRRLPKRPNLIPPMPGLKTASPGSNGATPASFAGECVRLAQDEKRFGDVLVAFLPRRQEVRVAATKSLGKRYEQCVLNALGRKACLLHPPARADAFEWTRLYDLQIGKAMPNLPEAHRLSEAWAADRNASFWTRQGTRAALRKLLPEDMTVESDGCLRQPATAALGDALTSWLQGAGRAVPPIWRQPLDAIVGDGVRHDEWVRIGPNLLVNLVTRSWSGSEPPEDLRVILEPRSSLQGTTLCLRPIDAVAEAGIRHRMNGEGRGWQGSFDDVLMNPRVALPADRRYRDLALPDRAICGVDEAGALFCAGSRAVAPALTGRFVEIAAAGRRVCAKSADGAFSCQAEGRAIEVAPPGVYKTMSTSADRTCGVKSDGALSCWMFTGGSEPTPPGHFVSLAPNGGRCALRDDGHAICWSTNAKLRVSAWDVAGDVVSVDGAPVGGCIVRKDGSASCSSRGEVLKPVAADEPLRQIFHGKRFPWCGVTTRGDVFCSDGGGPATGHRGAFRRVVKGPGNACALAEDGAVSCWGSFWPGAAMGSSSQLGLH